ncbi:MAG TPA: hypothetical protein VLJ59_17955 [Mycobacteriales bacterium]|nr:hypothetical protein [Mycobacteriales bacterium]
MLAECANRLAVTATALSTFLERGAGPPEWPADVGLTTAVIGFRRLVNELITLAVLVDRDGGGWSELGRALGLTAQAARTRYGGIRTEPAVPRRPDVSWEAVAR